MSSVASLTHFISLLSRVRLVQPWPEEPTNATVDMTFALACTRAMRQMRFSVCGQTSLGLPRLYVLFHVFCAVPFLLRRQLQTLHNLTPVASCAVARSSHDLWTAMIFWVRSGSATTSKAAASKTCPVCQSDLKNFNPPPTRPTPVQISG